MFFCITDFIFQAVNPQRWETSEIDEKTEYGSQVHFCEVPSGQAVALTEPRETTASRPDPAVRDPRRLSLKSPSLRYERSPGRAGNGLSLQEIE
jgi:hypothetical protein